MRKVVLVIIVVVILGLAGGLGYTIYSSKQAKNDYEARLEEQQFVIDDLQYQIDELGKTETVYELAYNVKSGTAATEMDIVPVEVPAGIAEAYVKDADSIVGMYYLLDYGEHTLITNEMLYKSELKSDDRVLDIICDRQPVGFEAGDIVDIRITFPDGQDYLLLHKKLVVDVYGNAMRLVVDEKDILIYKSAEADWARFIKNGAAGTSVQIYCTMYVEAGIQNADRFYPVQTTLPDGETFEGSVLWVAAQDVNLIKSEADLADWLIIDRLKFEKALVQFDVYRKLVEDRDTKVKSYEVSLEGGATSVNKAKSTRDKQYANAVKLFEQREAERIKAEEEAAKEAERQAAKAAKEAEQNK